MRPTPRLIVLALVCVGSVAQAAEPNADELIARGLELRRQSKPQEALEQFQKAHALAPSPRTTGQMGLVETSLERWLDADTHLTASFSTPDDPWVRKNRAFLDQAFAVVRRHLGELVITGPPGTDVVVDGKRVGTLPAIPPVKLAEGNVAVTANSTGFKAFSKTVAIVGGAKVALAIVLDPVEKRPAVALSAPVPMPASAPVLSSPDQYHRPAWRTWAGGGLLAGGAGLLAWGIVWLAVDGADKCAAGGPACTTVYDTKTPGLILAIGGTAAAAGGTILLLTGGHRDHPNVTFAATPSSLLFSGRF